METPLASLSNTELVDGICRKDYRIQNEFYRRFSSAGLRYLLRVAGVEQKDLDDLVHDVLFKVIEQLQNGDELRNAATLPGYVRTIAHRMAIEHNRCERRFSSLDKGFSKQFRAGGSPSDRRSWADCIPSRERTPEEIMLIGEQKALMLEALRQMKPQEIEILTRFYLEEQKPAQIQEAMGLTETQFRLNKCRAKAVFGKLGQRIAKQRTPYAPEKIAA